jgi:hypothetical protein
MNSGRTMVDNNLLPDGPINPHWLVGFCEGDSSFFIAIKKFRSSVFLLFKILKVLKLLNL